MALVHLHQNTSNFDRNFVPSVEVRDPFWQLNRSMFASERRPRH
jgi:hypothetical protein